VRDVAYALLAVEKAEAVGRSPFFLRVLPTFAYSRQQRQNYEKKKKTTKMSRD